MGFIKMYFHYISNCNGLEFMGTISESQKIKNIYYKKDSNFA